MPQRIRGDRCSIFYSGDLVRPLPSEVLGYRSSLEDSTRIEVLASEQIVSAWYGRHDRLTLEITAPCKKGLCCWRCYQPSQDFCHILEINLNGTINYWSQLEKRWIFEARSIPAKEYCLLPKRYREKIPESVVKVLQ